MTNGQVNIFLKLNLTKTGASTSRPTTPSPFDAVPKPQSLTMERIKNQTSATLDRMAQLQERYRQHQEIMKSGGDSSRRNSNSSMIEEQSVCDLTKGIVANTISIQSLSLVD